MSDIEQKARMNRFEEAKVGMPDLSLLETRVQRVIELVAKLRKENEQLRSNVEQTQKERDSYKTRIAGLESELAHARANGRDRTREEAIRKKVEGLLQRLEEL